MSPCRFGGSFKTFHTLPLAACWTKRESAALEYTSCPKTEAPSVSLENEDIAFSTCSWGNQSPPKGSTKIHHDQEILCTAALGLSLGCSASIVHSIATHLAVPFIHPRSMWGGRLGDICPSWCKSLSWLRTTWKNEHGCGPRWAKSLLMVSRAQKELISCCHELSL